MSKMIEAIANYIQKHDAIGFWVECDGNAMTATKESEGVWKLRCCYWTGKKKTFVVPPTEVAGIVENMVRDDPYAVYSLVEKPTRWNNIEVSTFMDKLPLKMCAQNFFGFTLSGDSETYKVTKHPHSFVTWRINGKEANFQQVLQETKQKLLENVYWVYAEI